MDSCRCPTCGKLLSGRKGALTPDQIKEIRLSEERQVDLAKHFGVTPAHICKIRKGLAYKWVGNE